MFMGPAPELSFFEWVVYYAMFFWPVTLLLILAMITATFSGLYRVFQKAGKEGWKALVPIYNLYVLAEIANLNRWYVTAFITQFFCIVGILVSQLIRAGIGGLDQLVYSSSFIGLTAIVILFAASVVMAAHVLHRVSVNFEKGLLFTFGLILLPGIFWPILGFGNAQHNKLTENKQLLSHE